MSGFLVFASFLAVVNSRNQCQKRLFSLLCFVLYNLALLLLRNLTWDTNYPTESHSPCLKFVRVHETAYSV
ncbi:uncharacterized protein Smp_200670 [Schistosoma mansoni]|uniref:Smp_200670 n=1 Tax=Schistosoma mansoni TaxID=6183 RepID=G4V5N9_SCHMA|nr:uncharacterized protein Smp_200670 [Schistosoma mansoni]|eukprot:XP_018649503.1 uncharacterized protein Smp_200670 [Schistosoma mansoni]